MADFLDMTGMFRDANVSPGDTVFVAFDTSGAVPSVLCEAVHHSTANACREVGIRRLVFMQFDTLICLEADLVGSFDLLRNMPMQGGGGTLVEPVMRRVATDLESTPIKKLFIITDGMLTDVEQSLGNYLNLDVTFVIWDAYSESQIKQVLEEFGNVAFFNTPNYARKL